MSAAIWRVKRRPTGVSYFRDAFPYLESFTMAGSMWTSERATAWTFLSLKDAREALRLARSAGETAVGVVRVIKRSEADRG